jgi:predicted small secreted protein
MKTYLNAAVRAALLAGTLAGALSSCGTVRGFGNDVETAGNAIERTANRASR